jgi:hypothetical protein
MEVRWPIRCPKTKSFTGIRLSINEHEPARGAVTPKIPDRLVCENVMRIVRQEKKDGDAIKVQGE